MYNDIIIFPMYICFIVRHHLMISSKHPTTSLVESLGHCWGDPKTLNTVNLFPLADHSYLDL